MALLKNSRFTTLLIVFSLNILLSHQAYAQEFRFQIVLGGDNAVKQACKSSNYNKYHVVNGQNCGKLKPKARKKADAVVLEIQKTLKNLGFDPGPLDGLSGKKTKNALKSALISKGLEPRITLDKKSLELLKEPSVRPIDRENYISLQAAYQPYEKVESYIYRVKRGALATADGCERQKSVLNDFSKDFRVDMEGIQQTAVNRNVDLNWANGSFKGSFPVWLMISSNMPIRIDGEGIPLTPKAVAPFGLRADENKHRIFLPLWFNDAEPNGKISFEPLISGELEVRTSLISYLPRCYKEVSISKGSKNYQVLPGPLSILTPLSLLGDEFVTLSENAQLDRRVIASDNVVIIQSMSELNEIIQLDVIKPVMSPTERFLVARDGQKTLIVDVIDGKVVASLDLLSSSSTLLDQDKWWFFSGNAHPIIWSWNDSFLIGSAAHGALTAVFPLAGRAYNVGTIGKIRDWIPSQFAHNISVDPNNSYLITSGESNSDNSISVLQLHNGKNVSIDFRGNNPHLLENALPSLRDNGLVTKLAPLDGFNFPAGFEWAVSPATDGSDLDVAAYADRRDAKPVQTNPRRFQDVARQLARLGVQTLPVELPIHYRGRDHFEEYRDDNPAITSLKQMFQIHNWTYPFRAVDTDISKETHCFSFNTDAYLARTFIWKRDAGDIVVMDRRCLGNPMWGGHYLNFATMDVVDFTKEAPSDYFSKNLLQPTGAMSLEEPTKKYPVISGDFVFTYGQGYVVLHHLPTDQGRIFQRIPGGSALEGALITADQKTLITFNSSGLLNFYDLKISSFEMTTDSWLDAHKFFRDDKPFLVGKIQNNEIVVWSDNGYFKSTADAAGLIDVKYEGLDEQFSLDQFAQLLFKDDIMLAAEEYHAVDFAIPVPPKIDGKLVHINDLAEVTLNFDLDRMPELVEIYQDGVLTQTEEVDSSDFELLFKVNPGVQTIATVAKSHTGLKSKPMVTDLGETFVPAATRAIAVAVDRYSHHDLPDLNYAKADASRFLNAIDNVPNNLLTLNERTFVGGRRASVDAVYAAVRNSVASLQDSEHLVLFMAGHGLKSKDNDYYFALNSTDPARLDSTAVSFQEIFNILSGTNAKVTILIDACHSGDAGTGIFATTDGALQGLAYIPANVSIFAAAKGQQQSIESSEVGGGYFTVGFEQIISENRHAYDLNGNGRIEATELRDGLLGFVSARTNGVQTPWMTKGRIIGDYSLF